MSKEWLAYNFLNFTVSYGGVEQVFRPAIKLIRPSGLSRWGTFAHGSTTTWKRIVRLSTIR